MRTLFKREKGQSMVETAIVLPILILVVFAIIDFGWLFFNKLTVANCARESARYVSSYYSSVSGDRDDIMDAIENKVKLANHSLEKDYTEWDYSTSGDYITVTVSSNVKTLTGMFSIFFGDDGRCPMSSSVTMYIEKY